VERPGIVAFAAWVRKQLGGSNLGFVRSCVEGKWSDHFSGHAWDWGLLASKTEDAARAQTMIDWLLANDAENFRRVGLTYFIWDRQIWIPSRGWEPYKGSSPHTDHVHFSFGLAAGTGDTSFGRWLRGELPSSPEAPSSPSPAWPWIVGGVATGAAAVLALRSARG
jgi:hypothetical protein